MMVMMRRKLLRTRSASECAIIKHVQFISLSMLKMAGDCG
jgi:hypothetical protein